MTILKTTTIQDNSGTTNFTLNSFGEVTTPSGLQPNIISRGSTTTPLILRSFNDIHFYNNVGSSDPFNIYLGTQMVPDSVYELTLTGSGGTNIDIFLYPNFLSYSGVFDFYYRHTSGFNGIFGQASGTYGFIWFDHQGGEQGDNPMGRMVIFNGSIGTEKGCMYFGCDRPTPNPTYPAISDAVFGFSRWNNLSFSWDIIGTLGFNGTNKRVWVRRIA